MPRRFTVRECSISGSQEDRKLKPVSFAVQSVNNVMKSNDKAAKQIDDSGIAGRLVNMFVINDDMIDDDNESYILRSAYVVFGVFVFENIYHLSHSSRKKLTNAFNTDTSMTMTQQRLL